MRLGSNGEAYFADGVDDFDDEESDTEGEDEMETAEEVGAIEALSALRLDSDAGKPKPSTSENETTEEGEEKLSAEEMDAAVVALRGVGLMVLPAVELSLCGGKVEEFDKHVVTVEQFKKTPSLSGHSGLVVRPKRAPGEPPAKALPGTPRHRMCWHISLSAHRCRRTGLTLPAGRRARRRRRCRGAKRDVRFAHVAEARIAQSASSAVDARGSDVA